MVLALGPEAAAMRRCTYCRGRGVYRDEEGRTVCLLCSRVVHEPEPDVLTKVLSNHGLDNLRPEMGPRVEPDTRPIVERVMTRIRSEASRGQT